MALARATTSSSVVKRWIAAMGPKISVVAISASAGTPVEHGGREEVARAAGAPPPVAQLGALRDGIGRRALRIVRHGAVVDQRTQRDAGGRGRCPPTSRIRSVNPSTNASAMPSWT